MHDFLTFVGFMVILISAWFIFITYCVKFLAHEDIKIHTKINTTVLIVITIILTAIAIDFHYKKFAQIDFNNVNMIGMNLNSDQ